MIVLQSGATGVRSFVTLQDILVELCVTVGSAMLVF